MLASVAGRCPCTPSVFAQRLRRDKPGNARHSPDPSVLFSGTAHQTVQLWQIAGATLRSFPQSPQLNGCRRCEIAAASNPVERRRRDLFPAIAPRLCVSARDILARPESAVGSRGWRRLQQRSSWPFGSPADAGLPAAGERPYSGPGPGPDSDWAGGPEVPGPLCAFARVGSIIIGAGEQYPFGGCSLKAH
jgi:hypothetical protein